MSTLSDADREYLRLSCEKSKVPVKIIDKRVLHDLADVLRDDVARGSDDK